MFAVDNIIDNFGRHHPAGLSEISSRIKGSRLRFSCRPSRRHLPHFRDIVVLTYNRGLCSLHSFCLMGCGSLVALKGHGQMGIWARICEWAEVWTGKGIAYISIEAGSIHE